MLICSSYCTGAFSRASACRLAFHRGALASKLANSGARNGAMMSVGLSENEMHVYFDRLSNAYESIDVQIGYVNSPTNVTLTGDRIQIDTLESWLIKSLSLSENSRLM